MYIITYVLYISLDRISIFLKKLHIGVSSISYEIPVAIEESSIMEPAIEAEMIDEEPPAVTFEIVENCSKRGQKKLFDSRGYSYTVKR